MAPTNPKMHCHPPMRLPFARTEYSAIIATACPARPCEPPVRALVLRYILTLFSLCSLQTDCSLFFLWRYPAPSTPIDLYASKAAQKLTILPVRRACPLNSLRLRLQFNPRTAVTIILRIPPVTIISPRPPGWCLRCSHSARGLCCSLILAR